MKLPPEIKYEYSRRRARALSDRDARVEALRRDVPALGALMDQRAALIFEKGVRAARGELDEAGILEYKRRLAAMEAEQTALLASCGLGPEALRPRFACPACEDTGYVGFPVQTMCACLKMRLLEADFVTANIDPAQTFETFETHIYEDPRQKKLSLRARDFCLSYADAFPNNETPNLLLMGGSGLGKTFLLNCIANRVHRRNHAVLMLTAYNFIEEVLKSIRDGQEKPDYLLPELLILDDLGTEPQIPNITVEQLFALVNERQCHGLATALATNLSTGALQDFYGERLFARLVQPRAVSVLTLEGRNLRLG